MKLSQLSNAFPCHKLKQLTNMTCVSASARLHFHLHTPVPTGRGGPRMAIDIRHVPVALRSDHGTTATALIQAPSGPSFTTHNGKPGLQRLVKQTESFLDLSSRTAVCGYLDSWNENAARVYSRAIDNRRRRVTSMALSANSGLMECAEVLITSGLTCSIPQSSLVGGIPTR